MTREASSYRIIGFCCENAISKETELAGKGRMAFEPTIKIVQIPCSSKVDILPIIKAFEAGADGIFVLGCPEAHCHLLDGNLRAQRVVNYTRGLLEEIGMDENRLEMFQLGTPEWPHFGDVAQAMTERIQAIGKVK